MTIHHKTHYKPQLYYATPGIWKNSTTAPQNSSVKTNLQPLSVFCWGSWTSSLFCWPNQLPHVTLQFHSRWATTGQFSNLLLWHHRSGWAPCFLLRLGDEVEPRKIRKAGDTRESGSLKINAKKKKLSKNSWNWPFQGSGNPQKVYSNLKSSLLRQRGKGPRGSLGPLILTDLALTYSPAKQQGLKFQQQGADPEPRELLHTHSCLARPAPGPPEGPHLQGCLYLPDS